MSHDYYDVYPRIKSGDVILWDFGILTPIIKRITGRNFLRCGLAWRLPNGKITVLGTGLFSPMSYVKNLQKKIPFTWVSTNLEITSDVRKYALIVLIEHQTLKQRFKGIINRLKEKDFSAACSRYLSCILYTGNFGLIAKAEYSINELVSLMRVKRLLMVRVSK